jgi:hypothetical protein
VFVKGRTKRKRSCSRTKATLVRAMLTDDFMGGFEELQQEGTVAEYFLDPYHLKMIDDT